jgi:hypothetical protein
VSTDITVLGEQLIEVAVEPSPVVEISVEQTPVVEVQAFEGGIVYTGGAISLDYQLVLGRLISQPSLYKELTYVSGDLTEIKIWNNSAKDTYLLRIQFSYTDGDLTQKVLTDQVTGRVLTVTYSYTDGNLTSIEEVFS